VRFAEYDPVAEFEWVMRGFYEAEAAPFCDAIEHLLERTELAFATQSGSSRAGARLGVLPPALRWSRRENSPSSNSAICAQALSPALVADSFWN